MPSRIVCWILADDVFREFKDSFTLLAGLDDSAEIVGCVFIWMNGQNEMWPRQR